MNKPVGILLNRRHSPSVKNQRVNRRPFRYIVSGPALALIATLLSVEAFGAEPDRSGVEFFEQKIRPIFADHCYKCHSADSEKGPKGGLLIATRDGLLKGGDSGPAIVPGNPEQSLLIKAVHYTDEKLQMPPKGKKLSPEQIADLEAWIKLGAPDPRVSQPLTPAANVSTNRHWAFQPIEMPPIPHVKNERWVQNQIDAFVLAKLDAKGMLPARRADKRTLIRRATYDLTGLPPTTAEVNDFLSDNSKDAFAKVVDRLLESPRYGERWARHWLDIARYADTKGYVFEEERRYAYAYTYRDYVIRAFNEDLPYDRFVIEQLAADQLDLGEDKRPLAAMGFLTLGRRFLNNQPDIIDDRIDVVGRGLMGLTVACARCHDHKFDPIPTKDYYSLYGIFASSHEPEEKPLLGQASLPLAYNEYVAERRKREDELNTFRETKEAEALSQLRQRVGEYLLAAYDTKHLADSSKAEGLARERKLDPSTVQKWSARLDEWSQRPHPIFGLWFKFAELPDSGFEDGAKEICSKFQGGGAADPPANPVVLKAFVDLPPKNIKETAERYGKLFAEVDKQWQELVASGKEGSGAGQRAPEALPDPDREALRQVLYATDSPAVLRSGDIHRLFDVPTAQKLRALRRKVEELDATHPGAPPRAMALVDDSKPSNPHVFIRGNPNNPGAEVPRQFLQVLAGESRKPFQNGSGRLELARAIASADNPLTARVIVNRVWLQYFGLGLVRTPSDFGLRSDPPTHPELLDYLASRFIREGWSLKKLHRLILLSNTYQQSSDGDARYAQIDPDNRLLWKMNRKRLDFESMRDSLLAVAGKLDVTEGGHGIDITTAPFSNRRTVYGFVERQNLPGLFRTFDFASPDTTSAQRFSTTVPQQALFLMNSPFIIEQARSLAARPEIRANPSPEDSIRALYQTTFQRQPTRDEIDLGLRYLAMRPHQSMEPPARLTWQYGYGEFDEKSGRVTKFDPLPYFADGTWKGGAALPDDKLGWVLLTATGGHPGRKFAAIRRWRSPLDGVVTITGTLKHESDHGDGVRGRIISSRAGIAGEWIVQHGQQSASVETLQVMRGDAIDFVTDCRGNEDSDSFLWAPVIKLTSTGAESHAPSVHEWNARDDFAGPKERTKPLDPIEKYAQVLLISDELFFVD